ncbi:MAG: urea ABC transporter permease subunit UrtB [Verrucomicrobiota bacterium]|nr:urea ABC transporter permease subunit UrtB [Verrucomicrobiota bacterium]
MRHAIALLITFLLALCGISAAEAPRAIVARALLAEDSEEQARLIAGLAGTAEESIRALLISWKEGAIFIFGSPDGATIPVRLEGEPDAEGKQAAIRIDTGAPLQDSEGKPVRLVAAELTAAETDSNLRVAMKSVLDLFSLGASDPAVRLQAISTMGLAQDPASLPALTTRLGFEPNARVRRALREGIALIQLVSEDASTKIGACQELATLASIPSQDALKTLRSESAESAPQVAAAARNALAAIETHTKWVNAYGTAFRGVSLGSILLVVAIGLAITFGLMGVINMAHGELIAVGAYTTYLTQNVFGAGLALSPFGLNLWLPGFKTSGAIYDAYFLVALPLSFLVAALAGIALERGIIRFLYRRPLESLLATWGVSLVLQQLFRLTFGANNVQVDSPAWLSGNWTVFDVILGWNRVFVIGFAVLIVIGTWALLTKTSLGLLIRAVMQNRQMAACMGVKTERVNMLTFGFGSGLAGLAGAFLSQIGNVGPSLGQSYIVDAFMTVVVGGVGNLFGTVLSALSIGIIDQSLQQILLNPVLGKILVLAAIILFLQWRPAGLFVTKGRSLEG